MGKENCINTKIAGELNAETKKKWYFKLSVFVIAFLGVGPFALPLLWFNPNLSLTKKIFITFIALIITYYLAVLFADSLKVIIEYYNLLLSTK